MDEILIADMNNKESDKEDLHNVASIEIQTKELENEHEVHGEMCSLPENCDEPSLKEVTSEQEIKPVESCNKEELNEHLENHSENRNEVILRDLTKEIVKYENDEIGFKTPPEQISKVKGRGWRFCKLLMIFSSTSMWLSFLVYCYLYLTTVCVPVEVFHFL